jgi:hypothetical protein
MTRREFAARLAERGPDISTWPQVQAARALLLRSAACRRLYLAALEADPTLAEAPPADGTADRLGRLRDQLALTPQQPPGWQVTAALPGVALAACGVIGLLVGWYTTEAPRPTPLVYAAVDLTPFTGSGE